MSAETLSADLWWSTRYSRSELFAFLRAMREMAGFRVVLFVVDNQDGVPMAVAATRSDIRGRDYVRTGFSHHLLLMPQGRWEVLLQSLSIEPYAIAQANGQVHPSMPEDLLPSPAVATVKR
ncbi:hypothetical protein [Pseudomonas aeruginosa]|uniref:hypothetical protein n=1 Tax=Pseudomonas aeruginosa TaxID=287 RepID=UPI0003D36D24|nr:hypothetical protein [Pseudomonas aeruginosa]ELT7041090.1 hypothetical protein [Pseudomonas aeruginosa]EMC2522558.1 hypothetical protein [Pseudomonas aeruginosa]ETD53120.1 hypothetical protein X778_12865 [Pseudomonas aeruginosa VRFPA07]KAA5588838.1 hypothetical protein F3H14_26525 [Pseudomonas aeruginosa]MBA5207960.1 hypothetical protein [Pseudomonas aeruginosa]